MMKIWKKLVPVCLFILIVSQTVFGFENGQWLKVSQYQQRQNYNIDRSEVCQYVVALYKELTGEKVIASNKSFSDASAKEYPAISQASSLGLVSGVDGNRFLPDRVLKKGELAEILYQTVNKVYPDQDFSTKNTLNFKEDIPFGFEATYQFMVSRGILSFDKNGIVGFENNLTLKEAVEMIDKTKTSAPDFDVSVTELPTVKSDKIAYLTFDDGVSKNTPLILETLKKNNVKATFFITGKADPDLLLQIKEGGHSIGNHTYSHDYSQIYSSTEQFWKDFNQEEDYLESILGYRPSLMRFPGGSNNTVSQHYAPSDLMQVLTSEAKQKGYTYFDWNVSAGDAMAVKATSEEIVANVMDGAKGRKKIVILMHQNAGKENTALALPDIIEQLQEEGYEMEALTDNSFCPQFLK